MSLQINYEQNIVSVTVILVSGAIYVNLYVETGECTPKFCIFTILQPFNNNLSSKQDHPLELILNHLELDRVKSKSGTEGSKRVKGQFCPKYCGMIPYQLLSGKCA